MATVQPSNRKIAMDALVAAARNVRGSRYVVKRGVVNYAAWPFDRHPFVISVVSDTEDLFSSEDAPQQGSWAIEIAAAMPTDALNQNIDDGILDEMLDDAREVLQNLARARKPGSNTPVLVAFNAGAIQSTQFSDAVTSVQGVTIQFPVSY